MTTRIRRPSGEGSAPVVFQASIGDERLDKDEGNPAVASRQQHQTDEWPSSPRLSSPQPKFNNSSYFGSIGNNKQQQSLTHRLATRDLVSSDQQLSVSADFAAESSSSFDISSAYQYSSYTSPENRITLAWSHVSVHVPIENPTSRSSSTLSQATSAVTKFVNKIKPGSRARQSAVIDGNGLTKPLLRNVYGIAKPGFILAIIGSSGAGKSTLMNILMGKIAHNLIVNGKVKANGTVIGKEITKMSAFLQQDDIFHPDLTVGEHMWFHARLRMPGERYSDKDRMQKIKSILHELSLTACTDTMIGGQSGDHVGKKTLSGGERKRLAFATEVLTNPSVFFCDEPTTGLDSFMAENVVQTMKHLAERGKTVVCTLHQPSSQIISLLDNVLVLSEGRVVYLGATKNIADYFAMIGYECPPSYNPFDHVLSVISSPLVTKFNRRTKSPNRAGNASDNDNIEDDDAVTAGGTNVVDAARNKADMLADIFHRSKHYKSARDDIKTASRYGAAANLLEQKIEAGLQPASTWMQYKMCFWRSLRITIRNKDTFAGRLFSTLFFATMYALLFANQQYDQKGATNLVALMYQMSTLGTWENLEPYAVSIPRETPVYFREQQAGLYSPFAYFLSRMLVEMPQIFGFSLIFMTIIYMSSNLYRAADSFFIAVLIHTATGWTACGIGYIVGFAVDNLAISNGVRRAMGPLLSYTAGMYINLATIPVWISWIRFISPTFYSNELLQINQWTRVDSLECSSGTAGEASSCFPDGSSILEFYGFSSGDVTRNVLAFILLIVGFRLIAFLVLVYRTYRHKNDA